MSTTTDIIPGMTEVMNYIKKQDEEIKKLKEEINHKNNKFSEWIEENKKLKEEIEELKTSIQTTTSYWTDHNGLLLEEKKKLQEEIEELKEENKKLKKGNETYEDLLAGEKGLIDEINKLHEIINTMACSQATTDLCMKHWIIYHQIDPKLLLGNWEEFYEKDEDGQWREKPKTD